MCKSKFKNGWNILNPGPNVSLHELKDVEKDIQKYPNFKSIEELKLFKYDGESIGYGVVSSLSSTFKDHRFDVVKYSKEIKRELNTTIQIYQTLKLELLEYKPDLVYIFNGRLATHLPAKLLCKRFGVNFVCYEVSKRINSYRLVNNKSVHEVISDEIVQRIRAQWTEEKQESAKAFFLNKIDGKDFDKFPSFTKSQKYDGLPANFEKDKKNIVIFNSTIDEYASIEGFENTIYEPDETAGIDKILDSFKSDTQYKFYLRVHPNMSNRSLTMSQLVDIRSLGRKHKNLHIIWPHEHVSSYALMRACEKVITFGSTTGVEATYWGTPSILGNYAAYENFGCVYIPKTHGELVELLRSDLTPLPALYALQYVYYWVIEDGVPFKHFKEERFVNGLSIGKFDGLEVKPDRLSILVYNVNNFIRRIVKVIKDPNLLILRLKKSLNYYNLPSLS
jgi:hypothetical protein